MHTRFKASALLEWAAEALLVLGGSAPLAALNAFVPRGGYVARKAVAYGEHPRQRLDIYTPANATEPAKVVVFLYGGSWRYGERRHYPFLGEALTSQGFVTVVADYRLHPEVRFPAFVEDGAATVRWAVDRIAEFGGDPNRVYLMGHSAGAYIAAMLMLNARYLAEQGLAPSMIRAMVGMSGPYAFDPLAYKTTRPIFAHVADPDAARPITFAHGEAPPMLLLHGERDTTVLPSNSRALATRVHRAGAKSELILYPDLGHLGIVLALAKPFRRAGGVLNDVVSFIKAH